MSFGYVEVHELDVRTATIEGLAATQAAKEILGLPDVRFAIVEASYSDIGWGELSPEKYPTYRWAFKNGADSRSLRPPDYVLRHEIGHDLFVRYLVPSSKTGQYGGDAPDWLDEMAAVAFEAEEQKASRRRAAAMLARTSRLIPLPRFLSMTHPELNGGHAPPSPEETFRMTRPASDETLPFYLTVRAFYDFLVDKTRSTAVVADLAAAFRRKEPLDRWILAQTGRADQRDSLDGLNADFLKWIESDDRYAADRRPEPAVAAR